jgi:chromate transporter
MSTAAPANRFGNGADHVHLSAFLLYFARLGALGFGGPIALAAAMRRDLVEARGWIGDSEYREGMALAQLAPGPLAAQLAIYLGWVRFGILGATAVAAAFIAPSFFMVLALAAAYVQLGGLPWMQGAFYGIGAVVIAIIARSAQKLVQRTLGRDRFLWLVFGMSAIVTAWTESEIIWLFLASGVFIVVVRDASMPKVMALGAIPLWFTTGLHGSASGTVLSQIFWYFAEAGTFVFGSGLAIVPFLRGGVVNQLHWLTEQQFLDAVAVAMITPGPVVITVAFIGYLVGGTAGATLAALGVFLPCYVLVILLAAHFRRFAQNTRIKAFVDGVTSAAVGAIAGAAFVLGRRAIHDMPTAAIAIVGFALLSRFRSVPEPVLIVLAGLAGVLIAGTHA